MTDKLEQLLSEDSSSSESNEQMWNLLVQILVPIVILLSFVAVSEITRYQVHTGIVEQDNRDLRGAIGNLMKTDSGVLVQRYQIQLIEAQKQRLLHALDQELAGQRQKLKLAELPVSGLVNMSGPQIDDPRFMELCKLFRETVLGEDDARVSSRDRRASPAFILEVYKGVLHRADLTDPLDGDMRFATAASMKVPVWPEVPPDAQPNDSRITAGNRQYILDEIAKSITGIVAEATKLQQGVLQKIYLALIDNPGQLSPEGRRLAQLLMKPEQSGESLQSLTQRFYDAVNRQVRDDLNNRNYVFLNSTWDGLRTP
jgi:hypothetical protein